MMSVLLIIGGAQLVFIGLIGDTSPTYEESKHQPLYIVRERIGVAAPRDRASRAVACCRRTARLCI